MKKKIAMSIYYKLPSTYKHTRKIGIILPGDSTIRRWLKSIEYLPGFVGEYLSQTKLKVSNMSYIDKKCFVLLDEMAISKCIEYNKTLDLSGVSRFRFTRPQFKVGKTRTCDNG
jgi:hypothetical protein